MKINYVVIPTVVINQWFDSLTVEQLKEYFRKMNRFDYGDVIAWYCFSKYQKAELYYQVFSLNGKKLSK